MSLGEALPHNGGADDPCSPKNEKLHTIPPWQIPLYRNVTLGTLIIYTYYSITRNGRFRKEKTGFFPRNVEKILIWCLCAV